MVFFGRFSRRKDSKLGNEFAQRREIFLIWENWLWLFCHFLRTWKPKKQKDTAPKTLLGYLPRLLGMSKTRWGLNMKIHLFWRTFHHLLPKIQPCRKKNLATWKNVNSLGKLPTLAGWKHPISETIHRKCQGLHVIFQKTTTTRNNNNNNNNNNNHHKKTSTTTTTTATTSTTPCFHSWPHGTLGYPPRSYDRIPDWAIPIAWHHVLHGLSRCLSMIVRSPIWKGFLYSRA